MYRATGDSTQLDRFVRVLRAYFARDGAKFYAIGIPITDGLKALEESGHTAERAEPLADFRAKADYFVKVGTNFPTSEVNYEQSIVAPRVQLLAEMFLETGDKPYLTSAQLEMPLLTAFCGRQPDFRLNEVPVRHWDDYWFGKQRLYGDTLPHYWSTINATAYSYFGRATSELGWDVRANAVLSTNLSLFNSDGYASCAHLYPHSLNALSAEKDDPWANDQDWALVNFLAVRGLAKP